jgi:5-methylthioadenosine/S-adenosylhomocysteine deaminase
MSDQRVPAVVMGHLNPDMQDRDGGACREMPRRRFLRSSAAGVVTGAIAIGRPLRVMSLAQRDAVPARSGTDGRRILLKGGIVLSMDRNVGDFEKADVLIEGKKIAMVGPNLKAAAEIIDATDRVVMPGFVDTHHHQYQAVLRSLIADALLQDDYNRVINNPGALNAFYEPDDAYIGELLASVSQMRAGVTTSVDLSQVSHSPAHSDACIAGLKEAGRRTVFGYSAGQGPANRYPQDVVRLRSQYFSSDDQLLTLALHAGIDAKLWEVGRQAGVPIISHATTADVAAQLIALDRAGLMRADNEYIHCTHFPADVWERIRETGGKVSIAPAVEMQEGHGIPPFQAALDHGIRPSLSTDVETSMTSDLFTIMRTAFTLQRMFINERRYSGEQNLPAWLTCRDVLEMATIEGARVAHLDHKVGSLTPGKEADIILLRTDDINVFPLNNAPGAVVTLMDTSNVDTVFIAGKIMMWKGRLVGVDFKRLRRLADRARDGILSRANYRPNLLNTCCPRGK